MEIRTESTSVGKQPRKHRFLLRIGRDPHYRYYGDSVVGREIVPKSEKRGYEKKAPPRKGFCPPNKSSTRIIKLKAAVRISEAALICHLRKGMSSLFVVHK